MKNVILYVILYEVNTPRNILKLSSLGKKPNRITDNEIGMHNNEHANDKPTLHFWGGAWYFS